MRAPDEETIRRARELDPGALAQIYERYFEGIYRYLYMRLGHQADAEDLTEQVFLKMVDAIPGYKLKGVPFSSWLYRIAHNLLVDRYRRSGREPLELQDHLEDRRSYGNPEVSLQTNEDRAELFQAIRKLTPEQQQVISMRFIDNLDVEEVASLMGRRPGAIHSMQHRALASLQRILKEGKRRPAEVRRG